MTHQTYPLHRAQEIEFSLFIAIETFFPCDNTNDAKILSLAFLEEISKKTQLNQ